MSNSECRTMRPVEVETLAERALWGERQRLLKDHNSYSVRNSYYPYRMDEWHEKEANICREYNKQISRLNRIRKEMEKKRCESIDYLHGTKKLDEKVIELLEDDDDSCVSDLTLDTSINVVKEECIESEPNDISSNYIFDIKQMLENSFKSVWGQIVR